MIGGSFGKRWDSRKSRGVLPNGASRVISNPAVNTKPRHRKAPGATRIIDNPIVRTPEYAAPQQPPMLMGLREGRLSVAMVGRFERWPWGQHPDEAYLADALAQMGCSVSRFDQDRPAGGAFDVAVFTGQPASWEKMRHFSGAITVLWTLDWLPDFASRRPIIEAAKQASIFMSSDQFNWKSLGVRNHRYLPGACEARTSHFKPHPTIPCAFVGALYNDRRKEIAALVRKHGGVVLTDAGSWLYAEELSKFVQKVKVVVGDNYRSDIFGYWSTRNYIIPGAGGFLLTPSVPGLDLHVDIGRHLVTYDSVGDLRKKLAVWIANDAAREEIRRNGHAHMRSRHSWLRRAQSFLVHITEKVDAS